MEWEAGECARAKGWDGFFATQSFERFIIREGAEKEKAKGGACMNEIF